MGKGYPRDFEVPGNTVHLVVTTVEWEGGLDLLGQNAQHRQSGSHEETLFQNKIRKKKCKQVSAQKSESGRGGGARATAGVCGTFQKEISTETPVSGSVPGPHVSVFEAKLQEQQELTQPTEEIWGAREAEAR